VLQLPFLITLRVRSLSGHLPSLLFFLFWSRLTAAADYASSTESVGASFPSSFSVFRQFRGPPQSVVIKSCQPAFSSSSSAFLFSPFPPQQPSSTYPHTFSLSLSLLPPPFVWLCLSYSNDLFGFDTKVLFVSTSKNPRSLSRHRNTSDSIECNIIVITKRRIQFDLSRFKVDSSRLPRNLPLHVCASRSRSDNLPASTLTTFGVR
jgi:hypothetical protein